MSEQTKPSRYMQELDAWTEDQVIGPLIDPDFIDPQEDEAERVARVKKAIRQKVLESYHNGQKAGPRKR
jgi:hypothetical protein